MNEPITPDDAIIVADSVTKLSAEHVGKVLISGSHGGLFAASLAAQAGLRAVILNDAGIGLEQAGIAGLGYLDHFGLAAATVGHATARIGDGPDMARRGIITYVNAAAAQLGCATGQRCLEAARRMITAPLLSRIPPPFAEARHLVRAEPGEPLVWALDSASLVEPSDAGQIVLLGSHGGLLGGRPETALKVDCLAAVFNDAGVGIDGAGITRLPALDRRNIAAATVRADSARIGDGRSTWETGILSFVNRRAAAAGAAAGIAVREFVRRIIISLRNDRHRTGLVAPK